MMMTVPESELECQRAERADLIILTSCGRESWGSQQAALKHAEGAFLC